MSIVPHQSRIGMAVGAVVGVVFATANRLAPPKFLPFIPSATSLGVGCINNWGYSFAYFVVCPRIEQCREHFDFDARAALRAMWCGYFHYA
jgi:hypothetical protein